MVTFLKMNEKLQPTRYDSKAKRVRKRLTKRQKLVFLQYYETQTHEGQDREEILGELARKIGVTSGRQVERILAQSVKYKQEMEDHFAELSSVALAIANNLGKIRNTFANIRMDPSIIGDLIYHGIIYEIDSGQEIVLQPIDENKALNLLSHLQEEFTELKNISGWSSLNYNEITETLISKLKQKGYKANFKGKCQACPR